MKRRGAVPLPLLVIALASTLGVAGCSGSSSTKAGPPPRPSAAVNSAGTGATTAAPTPSSTASTFPTTAPSPTRPAAVGTRCTTAQLTVTFEPGQGAAGTEFSGIRFRNRSETACTLQGYPGVSLLDARRAPIGRPAARESGAAPTVGLAAGGVATATFSVTPAACDSGPTPSAFVRIFPPGERADVVLPASVPVCQPAIRAVHPGAQASAG